MWRDRAVIELVRAVHHSFDAAGVTLTDHHREAGWFLTHIATAHAAGRQCPTDWSWVVPPISGSLTGVSHQTFDPPDPAARPAYVWPTVAPTGR